MNAVRKVVSLQDRVLELLREEGPLTGADIGRYLRDVDRVGLDVCLGALQRANKIAPAFGKFDLVASLREGAVKANTKAPPDTPRPPAPAAQTAAPADPPPTAEEEARDALRPPPAAPSKPRAPRAPAATGSLPNRAVSDGAVTADPESVPPQDTAGSPAGKVRLSLRDSIRARRADLETKARALESELDAARVEIVELGQLLALAEKHGVAG